MRQYISLANFFGHFRVSKLEKEINYVEIPNT